MAKEYISKPSDLKPCILSDEMLLAMGKIVRASAEIEDIITLFMCEMARISEAQYLMLLGRTPVSQKILFARSCAKATGGNAYKICVEIFDSEPFKAIFSARNIIAHGILLGETDEGTIAFRTSTVADATPHTISTEVISLGQDYFEKMARIADQAIPELEHSLKVGPSRKSRRELGLLPHNKAQVTRPPSAKHQRQRREPQGSKKSGK